MNDIYENVQLYFPSIAEQAVEYIERTPDILIIKIKDGRTMYYDDIEKTMRQLPKDSNNLTEEEYKREFGFRLREVMYREGITQLELSERTGISQSMLSSYTSGRNIPSFYKVDKIAKALKCSTDELRYVEY